MRDPARIISDIQAILEKENLIYELKSLKNELDNHFTTSTELIGEVGALLTKMVEKNETKKVIGHLVTEFVDSSKKLGLTFNPSKFYSLEQKTFEIDGLDFNNLNEFFDVMANNSWRRTNGGKIGTR